MAIVGSELIMPFALTGGWIERHHRAREQVIPPANLRVAIGAGIADRPIEYIQVRIVRSGEPTRSASPLPAVAGPGFVSEFAWPGNGIESPQTLPGYRIIGVHISGDAKLAASDTNDDLVFDREWGRCEAISLHGVVYLNFPERQSGAGVERDQCGVQRTEEDAIPQHRHAAIKRVDLVRIDGFLLALISPDLQSGAGVERDHGAR